MKQKNQTGSTMTRRVAVVGVALAVTVGWRPLTPQAPAQCVWDVQRQSPTNNGPALRDVAMWDDLRGLAVGDQGRIFRTIDGGQTWTGQQVSTHDLFAVALLPPDFAVVAGDIDTILFSHDGGATWQPAPAHILNGFAPVRAVDFVTPTEGWVVVGGSKIFHTADAGATWDERTPPGFFVRNDVEFVNANIGWVIGPRDLIWSSVNGGVTWTVEFLPPHLNPIASGQMMNIHMVNENVGWIAGHRGYIVYTMDGGHHWELQQAGVPDTQNVEPFLAALSETEAWLLEYTGLMRHTTDGGVTWQVIPTGVENAPGIQGYRAIFGAASGRLWFVGGEQTISFHAPAIPPAPGNLNNDCVVNLSDLCFWNINRTDFNNDGLININDAQALATVVGQPFDDCNADSIPDVCQVANFYQRDRSLNASIFVPAGDEIILNSFVVPPNVGPDGEEITAVEWLWGFQMTGAPITVAIWDDPNNDGNPTDAVLLASRDFVGPPNSWQTVERFDMPPTFVGHAGDLFFVGVFIPDLANNGVSLPFDTLYSLEASWGVVGSNLENLTDSSLIWHNNFGNWMIRAVGDGLADAQGDGVFDNCDTFNGFPDSNGADLNGDGVVNGADLAALLTQWGTNGSADLNGDGVVNGADLATLLTNWG